MPLPGRYETEVRACLLDVPRRASSVTCTGAPALFPGRTIVGSLADPSARVHPAHVLLKENRVWRMRADEPAVEGRSRGDAAVAEDGHAEVAEGQCLFPRSSNCHSASRRATA